MKQSSICAELVCNVLEYKPVLVRSAGICAELDCLISLALCAAEGNYCRPSVGESEDLVIEQGRRNWSLMRVGVCEGRHPMTEQIVESFIPNDTRLSHREGCIQVITGRPGARRCRERESLGPNASGKSNYMKQVALILFLAHIGSFVPALSCSVPLTDRIFTRICRTVDQRITRINQSTFMNDLAQIATMVKQSTPSSLLLIDEFGKVVDGHCCWKTVL